MYVCIYIYIYLCVCVFIVCVHCVCSICVCSICVCSICVCACVWVCVHLRACAYVSCSDSGGGGCGGDGGGGGGGGGVGVDSLSTCVPQFTCVYFLIFNYLFIYLLSILKSCYPLHFIMLSWSSHFITYPTLCRLIIEIKTINFTFKRF